MQCLEPDSLLERFAAKKANKVGATKEFIDMKGQQGQIELGKSVKNENAKIGFKCTHYSVTESSKVIKIAIVKKVLSEEVQFGIRTINGTATSPNYYEHFQDTISMGSGETEKQIEIIILDNEEWGPDLDFYIELFEANTKPDDQNSYRLTGDDTRCTVTILDEDNPGSISFIETEIKAFRADKNVTITIQRLEGSDGSVSCTVKTEQLIEGKNISNGAIEFEDFVPVHDKVSFLPGETEKTVQIPLVPKNKKTAGGLDAINNTADDGIAEDVNEYDEQLMFKLKITSGDPEGLKI